VKLFQTNIAASAGGGQAGGVKAQYDVAADGRFLMNVLPEATVSPITVILNWKPR